MHNQREHDTAVAQQAWMCLKAWRKSNERVHDILFGGHLRVHIVERSPTVESPTFRTTHQKRNGIDACTLKVYVSRNWVTTVWQHGIHSTPDAFVITAERVVGTPVWEAQVLRPWARSFIITKEYITAHKRTFGTLLEALASIDASVS